ncbi:MAG: helix-hairpin-helix domain-containing protein [Bdellovibrionales bacterium]|nr:helix-hairpin-helix domain-containing protein [Ramlibacter sp.]
MLKKVLALLAMMYAVVSFAAVDVNKASAAELDGVKGIGPTASSRILAERKKGEFKDWRDFTTRVKGIKDAKAKKYSAEGLTVNGAAYKGEAPPAEDIKSKIEAKKNKGEKAALTEVSKK